jgi:hypothetical protein
VKIYRNSQAGEPSSPPGWVFIGDAVFVEGARPDVETNFSTTPLCYRGGWGYLMLTNMLPNKGNGPFTISAVAIDCEGHQVTLGYKNISCANAQATNPFGTIDTPAQGEIVADNPIINFGWALTPLPGAIPIDGSTISVYVDGVRLGSPSYNHYRSDIASYFPGLANSLGAIGVLSVNTAGLADGLHTIVWGVTDNLGRAAGLGSRYFTVQHSASSGAAAAAIGPERKVGRDGGRAHSSETGLSPVGRMDCSRCGRRLCDQLGNRRTGLFGFLPARSLFLPPQAKPGTGPSAVDLGISNCGREYPPPSSGFGPRPRDGDFLLASRAGILRNFPV